MTKGPIGKMVIPEERHKHAAENARRPRSRRRRAFAASRFLLSMRGDGVGVTLEMYRDDSERESRAIDAILARRPPAPPSR